MRPDVYIVDPQAFMQKKAILKRGGPSLLHVVTDFDKTLSTGSVNGEKRRSLVEIIRKFHYLPAGYSEAAYALFDKYHPLENDEKISLEQRKAAMQEWWSTHVQTMRHFGMSRDVVQRIVNEQPIGGREGLRTFLDTLHARNIPLLIFSAAVTDLIQGFLKKEHLDHPNIHIISNQYVFDAQGKVTGYAGTIVHSLNKSEIVLKGTPYEKKLGERPHVILLGDALEDADMVEGIPHSCVLRIAFLNDQDEKLASYAKKYDVIILHDGPMDFVNDLVDEILR